MNKLLVSDIIDIFDGEYNITFENNNCSLNIIGNVTLHINNQVINSLNINMKDDSILYLYKYDDDIHNKLCVNINQINNSKVYFNYSFINNGNNELVINNNISGSDNESIIKVRNISNNCFSDIIINVKIDKNTVNNVALEDLKGIQNGGNIKIEPNIICDSNEIVANHLTSIGNVSKSDLEYLMSKGIDEKNAKDILLKGFIQGIIPKK